MDGRRFALFMIWLICLEMVAYQPPIQAAETFEPYAEGDVPQTVSALWDGYDARYEPLDVEVVREWKADGVVARYVVFTVGTFKGSPARIAAYYTFPDNDRKNPAFVWSHGGGQRAERARGIHFAKQGYATVDLSSRGASREAACGHNFGIPRCIATPSMPAVTGRSCSVRYVSSVQRTTSMLPSIASIRRWTSSSTPTGE